jgi:hypothetical protein
MNPERSCIVVAYDVDTKKELFTKQSQPAERAETRPNNGTIIVHAEKSIELFTRTIENK